MGGARSTYGGEENFIQTWVGKPEANKTLGRPRHRLEDNIKMDLQEVGCGDMDWIDLARYSDRWRACGNVVMNLRVP